MIRCHECDSSVAKNDLFCPYCGVVIPEASASEASPNDDSVSATATTEPSVAEVPVPDLIADFTQTDYTAPQSSELSFDSELPAQNVEQDTSIPVEQMSAIDQPSGEKPGIFDERPHYADDSISRPQQELEENPEPNAMFDSVRIMESKPQDM